MIRFGSTYYQDFSYYRIEKKITVAEHPKIKDYSKLGIYFYIIHEPSDNNRFVFISSRHYEEDTKINPNQFKLQRIPTDKETILLKRRITKYGDKYYRVTTDEDNFYTKILFGDIIQGSKNKNGEFYKKPFFKTYKCHTKKLAMDNPLWYLEIIKKNNNLSYRKKAEQLMLCNNKYNEEIFNNMISTFFNFHNNAFQMFNDHSIIIDEGKTGKSSFISYMGERVDNISVAGLYGSSDSNRGKFKSGLVSMSNKTIIIDELNELNENTKSDKILSILNTALENGTYNYQKQFSKKISVSNQFIFMGNIKEDFNFSLMLNGCFGNVSTIGRRIGIVLYDNKIKGFKHGNIRPIEINPYLLAVQGYVSKLINHWFNNKKNITKLYKKKKYIELCKMYERKLTDIEKKCEEENALNFIRSHKKSINRQFTRALKLWIWDNLDYLIREEKEFNNHTIHEVLEGTEHVLNNNIISFENIVDDVNNNGIKEQLENRNKMFFEKFNKSYRQCLELFSDNKDIITPAGYPYSLIENRSSIRHLIDNIKRRKKVTSTLKVFLYKYGCELKYNGKDNDVYFKILKPELFNKKTEGLFDQLETNVEETQNTNKSEIDEITEMIDMGDL